MKFARVVSVHFPKAAGSSLSHQLADLVGDQLELDYAHDPLIETGREVAPFPVGKSVVHGHFHPQRYDGTAAFRMTFLRHPVDNLTSIYFFWRRLPEQGNPLHHRFLKHNPDIFEFAAYPGISTLMSQAYFGGYDMRRFDFIGLHEDRNRDLRRLGDVLGLPLHAELHQNRTPDCAERQALQTSPQAQRRLQDLLADDIRFYERVRSGVSAA